MIIVPAEARGPFIPIIILILGSIYCVIITIGIIRYRKGFIIRITREIWSIGLPGG